MKETDLAKPVADWMRSKGYTVYSEVPIFERVVDMVGVNGNELLVVELKLNLSWKVIRQAYTSQLVSNKVYVGVSTNPRKSSIEKCKKYGIGVLRITNIVEILLEPSEVKRIWPTYRDTIIEMTEVLTPSDEAGIPNGGNLGPAQACYIRVKRYRKLHPKATWKEIYKNVGNHYSNHLSLAGAMREVFCRSGAANRKLILEEIDK